MTGDSLMNVLTREMTDAGLGLDYHQLRFGRTDRSWIEFGQRLRGRVADRLADTPTPVPVVETVGSSSVLGLLAKPIIDLAVGITAGGAFEPVKECLQNDGWIYRGDAGQDGGHVFVLETEPWFRVGHLHVVDLDGPQWRNYLQFRDLLRRDAEARRRYEEVKLRLAEQLPADRRGYTSGKTDVVSELLAQS